MHDEDRALGSVGDIGKHPVEIQPEVAKFRRTCKCCLRRCRCRRGTFQALTTRDGKCRIYKY
eukprot:4369579-Pleurochrysis_carterae.AAC.2